MDELEQIMRNGLRDLADEAPAGDAIEMEVQERIAADGRRTRRTKFMAAAVGIAAAGAAVVLAVNVFSPASSPKRVSVATPPATEVPETTPPSPSQFLGLVEKSKTSTFTVRYSSEGEEWTYFHDAAGNVQYSGTTPLSSSSDVRIDDIRVRVGDSIVTCVGGNCSASELDWAAVDTKGVPSLARYWALADSSLAVIKGVRTTTMIGREAVCATFVTDPAEPLGTEYCADVQTGAPLTERRPDYTATVTATEVSDTIPWPSITLPDYTAQG